MNQTLPQKHLTGIVPFLFGKTSALTLSCSVAAMTLFALIRTLISVFYAYQLSELKAMYYFVGNSHIAVRIVNGIVGTVACAVLFLMSLEMFKAIVASKNGRSEKLLKSLKWLSVSLIAAIFLTAILTVSSFVSAGLINYQTNGYRNFTSYNTVNAVELFFAAILFGALSLTSEIALTRLVLALQRTVKNNVPEKQGSALTIAVSSFGAIVMTITFLITLAHLVLPDSSAKTMQNIFAGTLAINTINVLLAGTVTVIFVTLAIAVSAYSGQIETLKRNQDTRIYNNLFSGDGYYQHHFSNNSKVFPDVPEKKLPTVSVKTELSFEIPHTEYPVYHQKDGD